MNYLKFLFVFGFITVSALISLLRHEVSSQENSTIGPEIPPGSYLYEPVRLPVPKLYPGESLEFRLEVPTNFEIKADPEPLDEDSPGSIRPKGVEQIGNPKQLAIRTDPPSDEEELTIEEIERLREYLRKLLDTPPGPVEHWV